MRLLKSNYYIYAIAVLWLMTAFVSAQIFYTVAQKLVTCLITFSVICG